MLSALKKIDRKYLSNDLHTQVACPCIYQSNTLMIEKVFVFLSVTHKLIDVLDYNNEGYRQRSLNKVCYYLI